MARARNDFKAQDLTLKMLKGNESFRNVKFCIPAICKLNMEDTKMTSHAENGLKIQSVSLGKGKVAWKVDFPPVGLKNSKLTGQWESLEEALVALKSSASKAQVDPKTVALADEKCPDTPWGS
ncbi:MAG TPA: hypothetical protein DGU45_05340 [Planctomycetes bacterium]|nr:hypothetical protein [Planctomycetota bacterium]